MVETNTYNEVFPANILDKYTFMETGSASKIAEAVCPLELNDIIEVLNDFVLSSRLLLTKGGNRGPIPIILDGAFSDRGWIEARIDLYKRAFIFQGQNAPTVAEDPLGENANNHLVSETYQQGYSVDNVKGRIALDVEWNPKDGNLDRDFSAYRAWHNEGLIDLAILITRMHEETRVIADEAWAEFIEIEPDFASEKQTVDYRTTTTANFEKARAHFTWRPGDLPNSSNWDWKENLGWTALGWLGGEIRKITRHPGAKRCFRPQRSGRRVLRDMISSL